MSREIKFRGKRLYGINPGEWVYGGLVVAGGIHYIFDDAQSFRNADDPDFSESFREVDPETVGQYTGLKDKNKEAVCEGDIIQHENEKWFTPVYFRDGAFRVKPNHPKLDYELLSARAVRTVIIGNIHDNKDLLTPSRV